LESANPVRCRHRNSAALPFHATVHDMARLARVVVPGLPQHVTQRGNRREAIFFEDGEHEVYLDLLSGQTLKAGVAVSAYCLMPNDVHLILKPTRAGGLGCAVGEAHRRYTNFINARGRWTGHLFQSRFSEMDGIRAPIESLRKWAALLVIS